MGAGEEAVDTAALRGFLVLDGITAAEFGSHYYLTQDLRRQSTLGEERYGVCTSDETAIVLVSSSPQLSIYLLLTSRQYDVYMYGSKKKTFCQHIKKKHLP